MLTLEFQLVFDRFFPFNPTFTFAMNCTISHDVPFSYDYSNFYDCDGEINGNSIYFNKSSSAFADCACVAGFGADPDIAGPGVSR